MSCFAGSSGLSVYVASRLEHTTAKPCSRAPSTAWSLARLTQTCAHGQLQLGLSTAIASLITLPSGIEDDEIQDMGDGLQLSSSGLQSDTRQATAQASMTRVFPY